jgi:hypothetical protein
MLEAHRKAAEFTERLPTPTPPPPPHTTKRGHRTGVEWHAERALEYPDRAYHLAKDAHNKSAEIVSL